MVFSGHQTLFQELKNFTYVNELATPKAIIIITISILQVRKVRLRVQIPSPRTLSWRVTRMGFEHTDVYWR